MMLISAFTTKVAVKSCLRLITPQVAARMASSGLSQDEKHDRFFQMEHENWEEGFEAYDSGFGPLTQQTIPILLSKAGFPPSNRHEREYPYALLDVATGPGFVLSAALDHSFKLSVDSCDIQLTGLDITHNFLALAQERISTKMKNQQRNNQINVQFVVGDAEKLSLKFPKNTFDSITCNFGILHLFSPESFLSEAHRVLRPGGRVSFSAWAPPSRTEGFGIALQAVAEVGNPDVDLPEGPDFFRFGDTNVAVDVMQNELGFDNVESIEKSDMKWHNIKDGNMLFDVLFNGTVRTKELLRRQTPAQLSSISSLVSQRYDELTNGRSRPLSMPAVVTSGQKPFA